MSLQWKVLFISSQKDLQYTSKGFTLTKEKGSNDKGIFLVLRHVFFSDLFSPQNVFTGRSNLYSLRIQIVLSFHVELGDFSNV